ncbi:MAG: hypothetical protein NZ866_00460 [Patescibacteria group bacterium]|nr:hypothetical protein [Patescibacteria group bacterium]
MKENRTLKESRQNKDYYLKHYIQRNKSILILGYRLTDQNRNFFLRIEVEHPPGREIKEKDFKPTLIAFLEEQLQSEIDENRKKGIENFIELVKKGDLTLKELVERLVKLGFINYEEYNTENND